MLLGHARHLHGGAVLSRLGCFQSGREVSTAVNHEVSRRTGSSTGSSTGPGSASSTRLGWVAWAHSTAPVQSAALRVATIVQTRMDERVIGHAELKRAITLGLLAREHVYVEGPPGVGKTMLAEVAAEATSLDFYFYQMHRDTRLQEMVGNSVIVREVDADGGGEVIRQQNEPGGIITAELCVLDDVSRAPGEALNILLRILNERKFGGSDIPLLSAIATANPADDAYYNEPLDPANIDRFALQVKASGLIQQQRWTDVAAVISLFASGSAPSTAPSDRVPESCDDRDGPTPEVGVSRELLDTAYAELQAVEVTAEVTAHLVTFLHVLSTRYGLTEHNSLLTDRTFLVKAVKILKAQACMSGRTKTAPCDMEVLSLLTTFRVPPNVHIKVPTILGDILAGKIAHPSTLGGAGAVPSLTPSVDTPPPSSHPSVATTPPRERTAVSSDSPASVENVVMSPRHPVPERLLLDKVDTGQPVTIDEDGGRLRGLLDRLTRGKGRM